MLVTANLQWDKPSLQKIEILPINCSALRDLVEGPNRFAASLNEPLHASKIGFGIGVLPSSIMNFGPVMSKFRGREFES